MNEAEIELEYQQLSLAKEAAERKFTGFIERIAPDFAPRKPGDTITDPKHGEVCIRRISLYADWRGNLHWKYQCNNVKKGGYIGRRTYTCLEPLKGK